MRPFKFLRCPLFTAHDGGDVYPGQYFYSMNKEEMESVTRPGEMIPKYTIVQRCVHPIYKDVFKPDHTKLWYFKSKSNAEYLKRIWERDDRMTLGGENMYHNSDITITFNR
jgi:hypothetical protein